MHEYCYSDTLRDPQRIHILARYTILTYADAASGPHTQNGDYKEYLLCSGGIVHPYLQGQLYCIDMYVMPATKQHSRQDQHYTLFDTIFIDHDKSYHIFFVH